MKKFEVISTVGYGVLCTVFAYDIDGAWKNAAFRGYKNFCILGAVRVS